LSPSRLEAFSDGVIAVAITLLVFNLHVPALASKNLASALAHDWPSYLAYLVSFVSIGVCWVNHHSIFHRVERTDRTLQFDNLFLLLGIATIPFATSLAASWVRSPHGASTAVFVYCALWIYVSLMFMLNIAHLLRHQELLKPQFRDDLRLLLQKGFVGLGAYTVAAIIAFFAPVLALVMCLILCVFYMVGVDWEKSQRDATSTT
jgi:uncharacterized membrane protein